MFRITAYAERLLDDLDLLDWPNSTKTQQAEWIGRSEGAEIDFPLLDHKGNPSGESLRVFTTRPDTIFGATYMVVAPEHPLVELALEMGYPGTDVAALETYVRWARNRSDVERQEAKEKTGVFTGVSVVNPVTKQPTAIKQQFVVTSAVTANATTTNDTTLTISPPIITSGPHQTVNAAPDNDATITVKGSASTGYRQNIVAHKNAMALAVVPLEMPQGAVGGSRQSHKGFSLRVQPVYDGLNDVSAWRLDMLYGRKLIDPRLATRVSGST
jgi:hypothetical protein